MYISSDRDDSLSMRPGRPTDDMNNSYLSQVFKSLPTPSLVLKAHAPDFTIVEVNDAYLQLISMERDELIGKGFYEAFPDSPYNHLPPWNNLLSQLLTDGLPNETPVMKYMLPRHSQNVKYLLARNTPVRNEAGEIACILRTVTDVTDTKRAEQGALQSHRQFESLIQTVDGVVWEADAATLAFRFVSDQVQHILGYKPSEWLNDPEFWQNHIYPADREQALGICAREVHEMRNHTLDYRMIRADGGLVWIKDVVSVLRDEHGNVVMRGLMVDVTEAKRIEMLEHLEKIVLEMNSARDSRLQDILNTYLEGIEALFPHSICSLVGIEDGKLRTLASPSLPPAYVASIHDLEIGENAGSCGTAAFLREQVIVTDIATDRRWAKYRQLALPHNLRACWSHPVIIADAVVATFAIYYDRISEPGDDELKVIARVAAIIKVILENRQNSAFIENASNALRRSNERYEFVNLATNDAIYDWDMLNDHIEWGDGFFRLFGGEPGTGNYPLARWADRVHPSDREAISENLTIQLGDPEQEKWSAEYRFMRADGTYAYVEEIGYIRRDALGKATRMIGVLRDITDRLRYISAIEERNSKLEEIAWMQSHVIRAPLARLMGIIDLIRNYEHSEAEHAELLDHVLISAHALDEIIRDISAKAERV